MLKRIPLPALPVLALVLLAGLYWLYWSSVAERVKAGVAAWAAAQAQQGIDVTWDAMRVRGFPTRLRLELDNLVFDAAGAGAERWALSTPEFHAHALPYRLDHVIASARSPMRLEIGPAERARIWDIEAASAQASYARETDGADRLAVDIQSATARRRDADAAVAAQRLQIHARRVPDRAGTADVALRAAGIDVEGVMAPGLVALLGREISTAAAQARVTAAAGDGVFDDLALLQLQGGEIQVSEGRIAWGPSSVDFTGRLTVDPAGVADGRFDTRLQGHEAIIAGLVRQGLIDPAVEGPLITALAFLIALEAERARASSVLSSSSETRSRALPMTIPPLSSSPTCSGTTT